MALSAEVVDFIWLAAPNDGIEAVLVSEVPIVSLDLKSKVVDPGFLMLWG
jgi:hypothetical protein